MSAKPMRRTWMGATVLRCDECGMLASTWQFSLGEIHGCGKRGAFRLADDASAPSSGAPSDE